MFYLGSEGRPKAVTGTISPNTAKARLSSFASTYGSGLDRSHSALLCQTGLGEIRFDRFASQHPRQQSGFEQERSRAYED
jgi:hypothetical protein